MDGKDKFDVKKLHSEGMVKAELRDMLGAGSLNVTLGMVESLWLLDSPYIVGGKVEEEDLFKAMELVPHGGMEPLAFHEALIGSLETAFRAYEIIVPDKDAKNDDKGSEIDTFSPEWLADTVSSACNAMPSLTYRQILWEVPVAMVFHLAISTARRNGCTTRRPDDMKEALRLLREHNRKMKE